MLVIFIVAGIVLMAVRTTMFFALKTFASWYFFIYLAVGIVCVLVLVIVYPATAYKLYRQNTTVRPQPQTQIHDNRRVQQFNSQKTTTSGIKKSQMHVQALKIYTAILLQFAFSTMLCLVALALRVHVWMVYFFWINHIGNPVIYYCFVPKFREAAKKSARALCRRK